MNSTKVGDSSAESCRLALRTRLHRSGERRCFWQVIGSNLGKTAPVTTRELINVVKGAGLVAELACADLADANQDGDVTAVDAALILQFGAGLIPSLPVGGG